MSPTRSLKLGVLGMCLALGAMPAPAAQRSSRDGFYQPGQGKLAPDLFLAISRNDVAGAKSLLARGADPNSRDSLGGTPLSSAAFGEPVPLIEALLRAGAKLDAPTIYGTALTALHAPACREAGENKVRLSG